MNSRGNGAPEAGPVPPAQMTAVEEGDKRSDEEISNETIKTFKWSTVSSINGYPSRYRRLEVKKGFTHCFSSYYTISDMIDYMRKYHGVKEHVTRKLFKMLVTSPGGHAYMRHSAAVKRGEASITRPQEERDGDPDNVLSSCNACDRGKGQVGDSSNVANFYGCYTFEQCQILSRNLPPQLSAIKEAMEQVVASYADAIWASSREGNDSKEGNEVAQHCKFQKIVTAMIDEFKYTFDITIAPVLATALNLPVENTAPSSSTESFQTVNHQSNLSQVEPAMDETAKPSTLISERKCGQDFQRPRKVRSVGWLCEQIVDLYAHALWAYSRERTVNNELKEGNEVAQRCNFDKSLAAMSDELEDMFAKAFVSALNGGRTPAVESNVSSASTESFQAVNQQSNLSQVEPATDQTAELSTLISERKYEEAFQWALHKCDVSIVSWLCAKVEPELLNKRPLPLSQHVLLSLMQQLACDIRNDTSRKLAWIAHVVTEIEPTDQTIIPHVREDVVQQVKQVLLHQRSAQPRDDVSVIRLIVDVIDFKLG